MKTYELELLDETGAVLVNYKGPLHVVMQGGLVRLVAAELEAQWDGYAVKITLVDDGVKWCTAPFPEPVCVSAGQTVALRDFYFNRNLICDCGSGNPPIKGYGHSHWCDCEVRCD